MHFLMSDGTSMSGLSRARSPKPRQPARTPPKRTTWKPSGAYPGVWRGGTLSAGLPDTSGARFRPPTRGRILAPECAPTSRLLRKAYKNTAQGPPGWPQNGGRKPTPGLRQFASHFGCAQRPRFCPPNAPSAEGRRPRRGQQRQHPKKATPPMSPAHGPLHVHVLCLVAPAPQA